MSEEALSTASFEAEIAPILERYEAQRQACVKKLALIAGPLGILGLVGGVFIGQQSGNPVQPIFIALVVVGIILTLVFGAITKSYKRGYKEEVIGAVVRAYNPDLSYQSSSCISQSQFRASKLFLKGIDRYRGEDYVSGKIGATDFEFSEIHAEYKTRTRNSKGRSQTQWHTIFKGVFFIADFHKDFKTHTVVVPDTAEKLFGFLGQKLQEMNFSRADLVKLEDPEFEQAFAVYGDDQVEARYILSTSLMRRILGYRRKFGSDIFLAFLRSKVYIALSSSKNRFEPKVFSSVNDLSQVEEFRNDLDMICDIVEDLNLNTRIWTKA